MRYGSLPSLEGTPGTLRANEDIYCISCRTNGEAVMKAREDMNVYRITD